MCDIFQSTESSRFFVYCEVSIHLFLLSLQCYQVRITFECSFRCSQVSFCCCCLSQVQGDWRFPEGKFPFLPQQRSLELRGSALQQELYKAITESYRLKSLFVLHAHLI